MLTASEKNYLFEAMANLLDEYDYRYSSYALDEIIDEWYSQKEVLIEAFKKHPNYLEGKFMIAFDADYERKVEKQASNVFRTWVINEALPKIYDKLPEEARQMDWGGEYTIKNSMFNFFYYLANYATRCISEITASYLNEVFPTVHAHPGQKTSRVVNKICAYLGIDKVDGYNREFAKYADSLSPIVIKRHTILSINPLDYLTMSFGNSWASCHTIDTDNKRGMPNAYSGCYSSGTISYMLDQTSMVLYTVDASYNGNEYWDEPKINRQMFHYGEEKLVQARLYPQDNDGDDAAYAPYRNIVQNIIATIFDFPNLWTLNKGTREVCRYIYSDGTNYPDYCHYNNCTISRIKGSENEMSMTVGASPICIDCGERHSVNDNINHCNKYICQDCGCVIEDEEDIVWIDDEPYCRDCCSYCECCNRYHRLESHYARGYGDVCQDCLDEDFTYCECCEEYVRSTETYYVECEDRYVCDDCLNSYYTRCEDCYEYYPNEDMHEYGDMMLCNDCYEERKDNDEDEEVC